MRFGCCGGQTFLVVCALSTLQKQYVCGVGRVCSFFCCLCGAFLFLFVQDLACGMGYVCRNYLFPSLRIIGQEYPD